MVGNYVYLANSEKVVHVDPNLIREVYQCEIANVPSQYAPIPLSPSLLEAAGFVREDANSDMYRLAINGQTLWLDLRTSECWIYCEMHEDRWGEMILPRYYSVHQLQNLHYALTQTELTINL